MYLLPSHDVVLLLPRTLLLGIDLLFQGHQGATESKRDRRRGPGWKEQEGTDNMDVIYQYPKRMDD